MNTVDLKMVEAVARHGSMNRAARELHTVQSNVTARIRALEEELGVPLFQRHRRGVVVTAAGRRLLPFAAKVGRLLEEARAAASEDGPPQGRLLLGTLETTAALRLPSVLAAFARAHPAVGLVVTTGTSGELTARVLAYGLDGAFVAGPVAHPDLVEETLFREELVLVTPPTVRTPAELAARRDLKTIVFRVGCSYRQRLDNLLSGVGVVASTPLEFGSLDAILGCVAAGVGVTLLPRETAAAACREGRVAVHRLPEAEGRVDTVFVRRRDAYVTSALTAFLAAARGPARTAARGTSPTGRRRTRAEGSLHRPRTPAGATE